jgi:hypothetical protein
VATEYQESQILSTLFSGALALSWHNVARLRTLPWQ